MKGQPTASSEYVEIPICQWHMCSRV